MTLPPGPRPQQPVDDDAVVRGDAAADDAQAVVGDRSKFNRLRHDRAVDADGEQELDRLIGHDCESGTRIIGRSCDIGTRTRPNWPGVMNILGLGKGARRAICARSTIVLVDEVDRTLERPILLVHELALHADGIVARRLDLTPFCTRRL